MPKQSCQYCVVRCDCFAALAMTRLSLDPRYLLSQAQVFAGMALVLSIKRLLLSFPLSSMGQALRKQESTNRSLCGVIIHSFWLLIAVNGSSLYDTKFSLNCLLSTAILN